MRQAGRVGGSSVGHVFERLVRDAQRASDLGEFRSNLLAVLARVIGADSGTLVDPSGTRLAPLRAKPRVGVLFVELGLRGLYFQHRTRYDRSVERLLRAMEPGRPVIDSEVYGRREREVLDLYAEVLLPQGARSLLCVFVRHRGRTLCQLVLKRHARGAGFRQRDADALARVLPALALADAGFQHAAAGPWMEAAPALGSETRPLGTRETEVALLVCKGMRNREIALLLGTSCETVKKQVRSVFSKLGVSNRAELAGYLAGQRPA